MPVLFLGHGSPMNAIEENEFVKGFRNVGKSLPRPRAILVISAHWQTYGTFVTAMENPRTIYDFSGFPLALYHVKYPAPGSPDLARETKNIIQKTDIGLDEKWGLDHGAWSVVKHLYPDADIPVIEMSLDYKKSPQYHYELAKDCQRSVRKEYLSLGVVTWFIISDWWRGINSPLENYGYDWALDASDKMRKHILNGDHKPLIDYGSQGRSFELAIPSPDHYLPLLYALALKEEGDDVTLFNDKAVAGSLTMTSVKITKA